MSLSGAMTSAVTGMDAQSRALGAISDNISNSQTTGYKRVDTEFSTLLTVSNALVHDPGGVKSKPLYTNDLQGTVQQTSVETNLAVSGDGYFAVSRVQGVSGSSVPTFEADPLYTRAGDFALDNNGFLVNNGGYYLNGWAVNPQTNVVAKNQLVQIQLNQLKASPQPTSTITYSANLPTNPSQNLNIGATTPLPFGQKFTFGSAPNPPTFSNGDTITVTKGGVPKTFVLSDASAGVPATAGAGQVLISYNSTISSPAQILGIVATGISGAGFPSSIDTTGNLVVDGTIPSPVTALTGTFAAATFATSVVTTPASLQFAPTSVNIFDAQGSPHSIDVNWTKVAGTNDTYTVTFTSTDPAVGSILPVSASTVVFNLIDNPATGAKAGSIKSINGVAGGVNTAAAIPLTVNFGGSTPTTQAVSFGLGNFGVPQQTTMFTGTDINFISALQDGLPPGSFRNLDIDAHGLVTLNFDNGARKTEFQIPLVQFSNYNGLQPVNGNAFSTTVASGTPGVHAAGDNGTGSINASSVEGADVDIAAEFTKLIQTQRAYEANSKVITTTNDLLQVTDNMIR
jgi:flagellar hook protein FlgE